MYQNEAGIGNAASKCRQARSRRRRRGAVVSALVPVLAAAMLLNTSAARAVDSFLAASAHTDPACQISQVNSNDIFKLPTLGGSYAFTTAGTFTEGLTVGKARLLGTIISVLTPVEFAVDLVVEGRLNPLDDGYDATCRALFLRSVCPGVTTAGWHVYTALSGTLTGLTGAIDGVDVADAVYTLSLGTPHPLPLPSSLVIWLPSAILAIPPIRCSRSDLGRTPIV